MNADSITTTIDAIGMKIFIFLFIVFAITYGLMCIKNIISLIMCGGRKFEIISEILQCVFNIILVYNIPNIFTLVKNLALKLPV